MKVKANKPKPEQRRILSAKPLGEAKGVIISGKLYEYGKEYTITKELYEQHQSVFTKQKVKEDE